MSIREQWIETLVQFYAEYYPDAGVVCYRRWAAATLDHELCEMSDYLSESEYGKDKS